MSELVSGGLGCDLTLSDEQRAKLGFAPGEAIRLLHSGGSTLLFERCSQDSPNFARRGEHASWYNHITSLLERLCR